MRSSAFPVLLTALLVGAGCDSTPRGKDAAAGQPPLAAHRLEAGHAPNAFTPHRHQRSRLASWVAQC